LLGNKLKPAFFYLPYRKKRRLLLTVKNAFSPLRPFTMAGEEQVKWLVWIKRLIIRTIFFIGLLVVIVAIVKARQGTL